MGQQAIKRAKGTPVIFVPLSFLCKRTLQSESEKKMIIIDEYNSIMCDLSFYYTFIAVHLPSELEHVSIIKIY
jgi:hypothetical protein